MKANFLDADGKINDIIMGCYGIGIGRTAAAAIEQNHDENGIIFPMAIAPFHVIITMLNPKDEAVAKAGTDLYEQLLAEGVEVLLDDRNDRPGAKFKDADLIGIPLRVTVGSRGLDEGMFELQERRSGERELVPVAETVKTIAARVQSALKLNS